MTEWLAHRADVLPAHPAVVLGDTTLTYRELDAAATALAGRLQAEGVAPGDRVALLVLNSLELVVAIHAVPRAGAILLPLNARLIPPELAYQLEDAAASLLLYHDRTAGQAAEAARAAKLANTIDITPSPLGAIAPGAPSPPNPLSQRAGRGGTEEDAVSPPLPPQRERGPGAPGTGHRALGTTARPFAIIYTSGTTGAPKGAVLSHENFFASAAASAFNMGVLPGDRWVACLPLFHIGGLSIVTRSAIYGTTIVVHPAFDEHAVNAELREGGATLLSVVPTMLQRMLDADDLPYPATVRGVLVGGGPVTKVLLERATVRGLPVLQTYGLTEATSQVTTLAPGDALAHLGSAGKPLLGSRIRIDAPPGEPGEILVSGPTVTSGYWNRPDATASALHDGWLHTGDIGRLDGDGFLYVLDRRDDLIVCGGENVYPAEVEAAIKSFAGVCDACVVGLPDERWGQVVAAAIVSTEGSLDTAALETYLRTKLAGYKVPRTVRLVESLPVTASGKVRRNVVRAELGSS
ncbi:MAG: o-succinylbenzoate--CoA ligase [Dehalococcoidia bacterium]|nr:o-succinylbenzoate--CoA ligase [Dehalococcoidia bacterium]